MEYPRTVMDFEKSFATEEQCREYLFRIRYPNGFVCLKCGSDKLWHIRRHTYRCQGCRKDYSVLAGTIFQDSHTPLTVWFRAIWYIVAQKQGASALNLQRILGLGSYQTAWTMLHKLRRAMIRPGREKLRGRIEVDEAYIGGASQEGIPGRGSERKALVAIAVEVNERGMVGRIRLKHIRNAGAEELIPFVEEVAEKGSTIITDGWASFSGLPGKGYKHEVTISKKTNPENLLPHVHTTVSLLKRWILGTLQGSCSAKHFEYYLDEYTFRYNRRTSRSRGLLFLRVLENAVQLETSTYRQMIDANS